MCPLSAVQQELSLFSRDSERDILPVCRELGIGVVAYSPLGRGVLTGSLASLDELDKEDWRRTQPRFQQENFDRNLKMVEKVRVILSR